MNTPFRHFIKIFALLALALAAPGQRLPVRVYKSADGLGSSAVNSMLRDSRGFLWFATRDGLSRFDGLKFRTYHFEKPASPSITRVIERRSGDYLVAAQTGGVYRFNAQTPIIESGSQADFSSYVMPAERVLNESVGALMEDADGRLWAVGGDDGLLRLHEGDDGKLTIERVPLPIPGSGVQPEKVTNLIQARDKSLWIITTNGLFRLLPDGRRAFYATETGSALLSLLTAVYETPDGLIWIGMRRSIVVLKPEPMPDGAEFISRPLNSHPSVNGALPAMAGEAVEFAADDNVFSKPIRVFKQLSDGRIWIVGGDGLAIFGGGKVSKFDESHGFAANLIDLTEDENGNVWICGGSGVYKATLGGFNSYGATEGLPSLNVYSIYEAARDGEIYMVSGDWFVSRLDTKNNKRFLKSVRPKAVAGLSEPVWTSNAAFLDSQNSWWFLTEEKLFRFDHVARLEDLEHAAPAAVYDSKNFRGGAFYRMWEDSGGDVWISARSATATQNALARWHRATGKFHIFTEAENYPIERAASAFAEDFQKNLWFGFYYGGLVRFRDGRFRLFTPADGLPEGFVTAMHIDRRGRLWIATSEGGIGLIADPSAENPQFVRYTTAEGLSSNNVRALTEDDFGRIYAGTVRGIDRLEAESGRVMHFTTESGLPDDFITFAVRARSGKLWFGTRGGAAHLEPHADRQTHAPPIVIGALRVGGNKQAVSEFGQSEIILPEFNHRQNNLQVDFFSIGFASADLVRYQYRLENSGSAGWSEPTAERTVTFANLAPGNYVFAVRAVNAEGVTSQTPAVVKFSIAPPTWQKSWFIALCLVSLGVFFLAFERYRAAKHRALKLAFGEIKISETRFRRLMEQSPLGTIIFAPDGRIRSVNQAYERFWGITFEQIKDWDFFSDSQIVESGVAEDLRRAFEGEVVLFEPTAYDPKRNGAGVTIAESEQVKWILAFAYPVKNESGALREVVLVMEDITEKKTAEEKLEKMRAEKARELEQVRRRIAADLHDDIGSSLTQISIWSEVLRQNNGAKRGNGGGAEALNLIADSSRELVDAMSEIVWAINPQKDRLSDLTGKMRRFAADSFAPRRIKFTFDAPDLSEDLPLGANLRRELFLIFKEAVNNIVKHAGCRSVEITFRIEAGAIHLNLRDDGKGFVTGQTSDGHGLSSMAERAKSLDGDLQISSKENAGTTVEINVPLNALAPGETN